MPSAVGLRGDGAPGGQDLPREAPSHSVGGGEGLWKRVEGWEGARSDAVACTSFYLVFSCVSSLQA